MKRSVARKLEKKNSIQKKKKTKIVATLGNEKKQLYASFKGHHIIYSNALRDLY